MIEFFCYLASQTLRGALYIVFMLTLQRLLRKRLSPRVRAILWAPLLLVLFAPNLCVVRVPVSQPIETTVVDALEQTRAALSLNVSSLGRVGDLECVYVDASTLETGPFETIAPPFADVGGVERILREIRESQHESFSNDESSVSNAETPPFASVESPETTDEPFASSVLEPPVAAPLTPPETLAEAKDSLRLNADLVVLPERVAPPVSSPARLNEALAEIKADAFERFAEEPRPTDARSGWLAFFQGTAVVAVAIWALGLFVAFAYLARSARVCRRWIRLSAPVEDADVLALYLRCADSLEIASPPRLATTTDLSSPAILGLRRPVVLVPCEYVDAFSEERLAHVLLHELGHFKRGDAATGFVAFVVLAAHWFNPLFWLAARSFHATREEACDALALGSPALRTPNSAAEYARTLCEIAGRRPLVEQA
ncbi:MAG: M56 family metallopeptidase, partial [Thermoguttaceae bacterium]|nr:M56 family metallopeptidase [Thermoguttaceae bacterium]